MRNSTVTAPAHRLCPEKKTTPPRRRSYRPAALLLAIVVLTLVAWFRMPQVTRGTLWAEDASVFLAETISIGAWQSVFEPYAGYLHTIPRIISGIAYTVAPIDAYATLITLLSCTVVAAIGVATYVLAGQHFNHRAYRLMLALIPILVPVGPLEVLGNVANLHWYMLWLCPWLLIYEPRRWPGRMVLFTATLATATTEIIAGIFLPLALWTMLKRRNYAAPAALLVGIGLQLLATLATPRYAEPLRLDSVEPLSVVYGFLLQAVGSLWETNPSSMALNVVTFGGFAVVIPCIIIFGLLAFNVVYGRAQWKVAALYSFGAAAVCWTAATVLNPSPEFDFANFSKDDWLSGFTFFRYAAAPSMFLLALIPIACAVAEDRGMINRSRAGYLAPLVLTAFLSASYFQAMPARQTGPEWAHGVKAAAAQCSIDPSLQEAVITVTPTPWRVAVPCRLLADQ